MALYDVKKTLPVISFWPILVLYINWHNISEGQTNIRDLITPYITLYFDPFSFRHIIPFANLRLNNNIFVYNL